MSLRKRLKDAVNAFKGNKVGSMYFGLDIKACRDCEYRNARNPTLRDNLLVTAGARAAYMDDAEIIDIPSGVEGEAQLAIFISDVVDRYLSRFERINFDQYIETVLKEEYGLKGE